MNARRHVGFGLLSSLSVFAVACGDSLTTGIGQSSQGASAQLAQAASVVVVTLPGRIVYSASGTVHVYTLSTGTNVSLGVSGVNPKYSADGSLITYQTSKGSVRVMNADGTNQRALASGGVPSFDPTGTIIVFSNGTGIAKVPAAGGSVTQLTTDGGMHPAFSPDGTQIVYNAPIGGTPHLVFINANGTNPQAVAMPGALLDVVWRASPNVLFAMLGSGRKAGYNLYTYDPIAKILAQLTSTTGSNYEPSWSPDAAHISWSGSGGIWIMNADGTGQQGPVIASGRQGSWGP